MLSRDKDKYLHIMGISEKMPMAETDDQSLVLSELHVLYTLL